MGAAGAVLLVLLLSSPLAGAEHSLRDKLAEYFQKADLNKDGLFDRQELNTFVRSLLPAALHPRTLDQDTLDTAALLAEKAFDQAGPDSEDRLSFRGSLLQRPPAAVLGEGLVNMLVDLADQVDGLEDDFSRSGLRARRAQ